MRALIRHAVVFLFALNGASLARATEVVQDVQVRPNVTARVLLHRGDPALPTLILLPGGDGHIFITSDGVVAENRNIFVRMRRLFWKRGFSTAVVDAPTDRQGPGALADLRTTDWHANDLEQVARAVGEGRPVWLVGASRGVLSVANAMARRPYVFAGGVFAASPLAARRKRDQTVFDVDLAAIKGRVLLLHHEEDNCIGAPPELLDPLAFDLTSARVDRALVAGGLSADPDLCGRLSHHNFFAAEKAAVDAIADFITR